jgi:hypothetical protein
MHITKYITPNGKIQASFQYQLHVLTKTKPHNKMTISVVWSSFNHSKDNFKNNYLIFKPNYFITTS